MIIQKELYLELLRKNQVLDHENQVLFRENQILSQELEKQKCLNLELIQKMKDIQEHSESLNKQVMNQNEMLHNDVKGQLRKLDQKQRKYLDQQFQHLETSSFQKCKLLQVKNTAARLSNHELTDFCEKVKKIYQKSHKDSYQPSFKDLLKWIKAQTSKQKSKETKYQNSKMTVDMTDNSVNMPWTVSKVM